MDETPFKIAESSKVDGLNQEAKMADRCLPSFFVIGPPRTGSTWLHRVLSKHAVLPSPEKEVRFFDSRFHLGVKWYRSRFPALSPRKPLGEVSPTYFASASASLRISRIIPDARAICTFRNPVERVWSLYRLKRAYGMIPWNFEDALVKDPELLQSSKYATGLRRWQLALGSKNVLPTFYDDLAKDPQAYLDSLVDFIGIPRFVLPSTEAAGIFTADEMTMPKDFRRTQWALQTAEWFKVRGLGKLVNLAKNSPISRFILGNGAPFRRPPRAVLIKLCNEFRPEVEALEDLSNRDLSPWKQVFDLQNAPRLKERSAI